MTSKQEVSDPEINHLLAQSQSISPKIYISSKIIAKTLLEMMSLITLCDFEIFQFSHENSKFPIQTQLRAATRIEKQTETKPD